MNAVAKSFDEFDEALKLDSEERQAAIGLHHEIREVLANAGVCGSAILQGSFARKTMLAPLKDIDMIGFLNCEHEHLKYKQGGVGEAMGMAEDAIRAEFPTATFHRARHAVQIAFSDRDFTFDLVPAFEREDGPDIYIANYDDDTWDWSNTRTLIEKVRLRNQDTDGRFIHQVRMLKHWNRSKLDGLSGLFIESAAYDAITGPMSHPDAMCAVLRRLEDSLRCGVQYEPTGVDNLYRKLEPGVVDQVLPIVVEARKKAEEALDLAESGDESGALAVWYDLFGDPFPEPPPQSVEEAFKKSLEGGLTSTGIATATSVARVSTPPVRPWRP